MFKSQAGEGSGGVGGGLQLAGGVKGSAKGPSTHRVLVRRVRLRGVRAALRVRRPQQRLGAQVDRAAGKKPRSERGARSI